jgi:hypothetical protein
MPHGTTIDEHTQEEYGKQLTEQLVHQNIVLTDHKKKSLKECPKQADGCVKGRISERNAQNLQEIAMILTV